MKKSLLSMAALAFATFGSMANEYTFDFMGQDDMYGLTRSATTTEAQMSFVTDVSASEEGINFNAKAEGTGKGWALVYGVKLVGGQVNPSTTRNQGLYLSSKMTPEITLTVPNGKITGVKLNMAGTSVNTMDVTFNDAASGVEGKPVSTGQTTYYAFSWSSKEGEETVKITWPVNNYSGKYLNSIEVTYTVDLGGKAACGLSFAEGTAKGAVGVDFTAPELSNPNGLDITWTSSAPDVATVDDEGNVTPVAPGKTVITAATQGNDNFAAGDAKYQLTVVPTGTSLSALLEDAPAAGDAVWVDFPLTVTFAASNRAFVIDAEGKAGCIEDTRNEGSTSLSSTTIYKVGDIIPAGWMATNATEYSDVVWKGLPSDVTETTEVTYPEVTSVNCQADADRVVILKNVTFTTRSASGTTKAYGTTPDGVRYEFQDTYNTPDVAPGTYDVTCVVRYTNRLGTVYAWLAPLAYNEVVLEFPESFEVTANCEGVDVTQGEDQGVYTINVNGEIEEDTFTITLGVPEGWDGFIGLTDADYEGEGEVLKAKKYAVSDDEDDWTPIDAMLQGGLKKGNVLEFPADGEEHFGQLYLYTGDKVYMNLISLEVNVSKKEAPVFEGVPENINTVNPAPGTYQGWTAQDIEVVVKGYVYGNADKGKVTITNPEGTVKEFGTKENGKYNGVIANIGDFISAPGTYKVVVDITGCTLKDSSFGDISMPVFTYDYEVEEAAPTTYIPSGITVTPDPTQDVYELPSVKVDFTGLGATMVNSLGYKATAEVTGPDGFSKTVELGDADYTGKAVIYRTGITGLGEYVVTIDLEGQEYFANGWKDFPAEKIVLVYNVVEKPLPTFPEAITMTANNDDVEITIEDDETSVTISAIGTVKAEEVTLTYGALPEDWTGIYTVSGGMMMNNLRTATGDDDEYLWVSLDEFNEQYEGATITEGLSVTVPADGQRHQYMSFLFAGDKVYVGKGIMLAANIAAAPTTYIPSGITVTPDPTQDVYELPSVKVDFTGLGATMVNSLGYKATAEVTGPDGFSKTVELGDADYTGKAVIYRTGITGLGEYVVTIDLEGQEYFANGWKDFPAEKIVLVYNVVEKPLPTFPEAITMTANNDDVEITIEDDETSVTISAIGTVKAEEVTLTYGALPEDWTGIYTVSGGMMMMKNLRTATGDDDEYLWVSLDEFNEQYEGATITEGLSVTVPADGQRHQYMSYLFAGDKVYVGKGIMLAANIAAAPTTSIPSGVTVTPDPSQDVYELSTLTLDFANYGVGVAGLPGLSYIAKAVVTGPDGFSKTVEKNAITTLTPKASYDLGITGLGEYVVTIDLAGSAYFSNANQSVYFPDEKIVLVYNVVEKPLPTFPEAITMTADSEDVEITVEDDESSVTISAIGTTENESVTLTYGALPEDWTGIYTVSGGMMMNNLRTATGDDDEYLWVSLDEFNEQYEGATITEGLTVTVPADGQRHQYMSYLFAGDKVYIGKGIMLAANISQVVLPEFPAAINVTTESEGVDIETASDESGFSVDVTGKTKDEEVTLTIGVSEGWDGMYIIDMAAALMNLRTATGDEEDWISIDEFKADPMGESAVEGNTIVIPTNNDYYHYNCYLFAGDKVYIGKGIDLTAHIEKDTQVGISLIEAVDPDARYFDMSGVEIKNPANGLYIKVAADGKVSKVIVK